MKKQVNSELDPHWLSNPLPIRQCLWEHKLCNPQPCNKLKDYIAIISPLSIVINNGLLRGRKKIKKVWIAIYILDLTSLMGRLMIRGRRKGATYPSPTTTHLMACIFVLRPPTSSRDHYPDQGGKLRHETMNESKRLFGQTINVMCRKYVFGSQKGDKIPPECTTAEHHTSGVENY